MTRAPSQTGLLTNAADIESAAMAEPEQSNSRPRAATGTLPLGSPSLWKLRVEDPLNRYYRYPIGRLIVRVLLRTPVTPNQVTLVQPLFAALAGYLITFEETKYLLLAALVFELRSVLDCVDGTLARAKNMTSPTGHAIDGAADWLGVMFLYAGIFVHFHQHPPTSSLTGYISVNGILLLALFQGAVRSFAADYYKTKYVSIFETGRDETVDALRRKVLALTPESSFFAHFEVFIGRMGHLAFEHEWFDPKRSRSSLSEEHLAALARTENGALTRFVGFLWAISNGDAFLSLIILSALVNQLWLGQVFFATVGFAWIFAVILLNGWFVRSTMRRSVVAEAT
jgi:phosphatidylglycerophosphate synthase